MWAGLLFRTVIALIKKMEKKVMSAKMAIQLIFPAPSRICLNMLIQF